MNLQDAGVVHRGAAVAVADGHRGQGTEAIQLRHRRGAGLDPGHLAGKLRTQVGEQLIFQGGDPVAGGENIALQVFQLLGDIALAVYQGLLSDIGVGDLILEGVGHLDIIAEHLVIADFQGADTGFLFLLGLHRGHEALAPVEDAPEPVHLRVEAVPDKLALPDGEGGLVPEGIGNTLCQVIQGVQGAVELVEATLGEGRQQRLDSGKLFHGGPQGHHIPAPGAAVDDAAHEPLHITDTGECQNQLLPGDGVIYQALHAIRTAVNIPDAEKRPFQPAAQHPRTHGGLGLIQHPQEAALFFLAAEGLRQL